MGTCNNLGKIPLIMRIMALSVSTANKAGEIIRNVKKSGNLGIIEKQPNDFHTEADRSAQKCIIGPLNKRFPKVKTIGEEDLKINYLKEVPSELLNIEYDKEFLEKNAKENLPEDLKNIKEEDLCIWVDPLDSTKEYIQDNLECATVLIGIALKNKPIGGVINQPYYCNPNGSLGRTVWGIKNYGIGGVINCKKLPKSELVVTTTKSHFTEDLKQLINSFNPTKILSLGGTGLKCLYIIDNLAHVFVFPGSKCQKWDTCGPEAIIEANGGKLTNMNGKHYEYHSKVTYPNENGILATANGVRHEEFVEKIKEFAKK